MPEKGSGTQHNLWTLFGWMKAAPMNLTVQERERSITSLGELLSKRQNRSYYQDQVTPSTDIIGHMSELREMAQSDIIHPLIDLYAEECTQPDVNTNRIIWYECSDGGVEEELNEMLDRINVEDQIYSIAFNTCSLGNDYRRILRSRENGVEQVVKTDPTSMERIWEDTTRKLIGFRWQGQEPTEENGIQFGDRNLIFAPWEFIHFRRVVDSDTEYGESLFESIWPLYRKLKMANDQMVQYRMHIMPTRHALMIDTGDQSILESAETVNMFRSLTRNAMLVDPGQGMIDSRYNPAGLDSMLYFPVRSDEETKIETLQGDKDVPDVFDMELLYKQLFAASRIPKAYMGFEESTGIAQASLVSQDIRFARMVRVLRKPIIQGFHRLAEIQLALKGYDPDEYKIEVHMSKISSLEEEMNASILEKQADFANTLVGICQSLEIPNREIIDLVFREYLHVPRRFVDLAKLAAAVEQAVNPAGGEGEEGAPFGGGLGGMGGGMDDLGGLGGELGVGDDMGGMDDTGGEGMEEPAVESRQTFGRRVKPLRPVPLTEAQKRGAGGAVAAIRSAASRLEESAGGAEKHRKLLAEVRRMGRGVAGVGKIRLAGKTSLVEGFSRGVRRQVTESVLPFSKDDPDPRVGITEAKAKLAKLADITAKNYTRPTRKVAGGEINEAREHPAVKSRNRMRG